MKSVNQKVLSSDMKTNFKKRSPLFIEDDSIFSDDEDEYSAVLYSAPMLIDLTTDDSEIDENDISGVTNEVVEVNCHFRSQRFNSSTSF